jgi:hypothetical protein
VPGHRAGARAAVAIPGMLIRNEAVATPPLLRRGAAGLRGSPTFFRESVTPLGSGYVVGLVPVRIFDPVEKLSQAHAHIFVGPVLEKGACHAGVRPRPANDGVEERRVSSESVAVHGGAGVDVRAMGEESVEDLALAEINGQVQHGGDMRRIQGIEMALTLFVYMLR